MRLVVLDVARAASSLAVVLSIGCSGSGGSSDELEFSDVPANITCGVGITTSCTVEGQWCASGLDDCNAQQRFCRCTSGLWECTVPVPSDPVERCEVVPQARCNLEGTGLCDREPRGGGSCACTTAGWTCTNFCDGCPSQRPNDGEACTGTPSCRYADNFQPVVCECVGGGFRCQ